MQYLTLPRLATNRKQRRATTEVAKAAGAVSRKRVGKHPSNIQESKSAFDMTAAPLMHRMSDDQILRLVMESADMGAAIGSVERKIGGWVHGVALKSE